jgi:hypothetical protein
LNTSTTASILQRAMATIPAQADEELDAPSTMAVVDGGEGAYDVEMGTLPVIHLPCTCESQETFTTVESDSSGDIMESAEAVVQTPQGDDGYISAADLESAPIAYQIVTSQHEQIISSCCQPGTGSHGEQHNNDSSSSGDSFPPLRLPLHQRRAEFMSATVIKPNKDTSMGMELTTINGDVVISSIIPNSLVAGTPFRVGDRLLSVNTKRCYIMESKDVESFMATLEGFITIIVHHQGGDPNLVESMVTLPSDASRCGLGLTSAGGRSLKISSLDAGGLFFDSLLNVGDPVVSINDEDCEFQNAEDAAGMIERAGQLITIKAKTLLETGVVVAAYSSNNSTTGSVTAPQDVNQTEVEKPSHRQTCFGIVIVVLFVLFCLKMSLQ